MNKKILWIASYPKSGSTWMRAIVSSLFFTNQGKFSFEYLNYISTYEYDKRFDFIKKFRKLDKQKVLVVVPSSYNKVRFEQFEKMGVNIVIYANHMLRSAYPNMKIVAEKILENGRSLEAEEHCLSIKEILDLIPGTK